MTKRFIITLLGASLLMALSSACDRKEKPEEYSYAHATATIPGGSSANSTKALFEGGATKDTPKVINWGKVGETLDMLVYYPTTAVGKAVVTSMTLKSPYLGDLTLPYKDENVADGVVKYFATSGVNNDANITKGAVISKNSTSMNTGVVLSTDMLNGGKVDMSKPGVLWPLVSADKKEGFSHLWSSVKFNGGGPIHFQLFGNVFFVHFDNLLDVVGYDANSNATNFDLRPKLTIESNGMAFAGSAFSNNVFANLVNPWTVSNSVNKVTYQLSKLDFSDKAKRQELPIWFRPMTPLDGAKFFITVTWEVYNTTTNSWDKSIQKFRLPDGKSLAANGTMFADYDGRYYRMNVGISPKIGVEFGSNSFHIVDITPPAFD